MLKGKWVPFGRGYLEVEDLVARFRRNDRLYPHEREFFASFLEKHWHHGVTPRDCQRTNAWVVTEFVVTLQMQGIKTDSIVREAEDIFGVSKRRVFQMVKKHRKEFEMMLKRELEQVQKSASIIAPLSECQAAVDHLELSPPLSWTEVGIDDDIK